LGRNTWRADASRVAVLGGAVHAETQLKAVAAVRKLTAVWVFSPTPERRAPFAAKKTRELDIPVDAVEGAEESLANADRIITTTNADTPVFDAG
jgi:ornithine cyclodeaminase/alanine dehydrogenase-like protein (mu-crystallin family)